MLNPAEIRDMNMAAQDQAITGVHPALHLARAVEAATLATVTPLVQQMLEAHYGFQNAQIAFLTAARAEEPDEVVERLNRVYQAAAAELDRAAGNLDAFLSGATKGEPS